MYVSLGNIYNIQLDKQLLKQTIFFCFTVMIE